MNNNSPTTPRKSLGSLRKTPKTKPKSPDTQGAMKVQRHTVETLLRQLDEAYADEIIANIAGWFNEDSSGKYISVELSPRYVSRHKRIQRTGTEGPFDSFFQDKEDFH